MANQYVFKRVEMKFLLTNEQYETFFERTRDMAKVDSYGLSQILNIYYDTENFKLIRTSLDKPVYKEKLRLRSYGVPTADSPTFIELKKKYDGIVYKRRVELPHADALRYLNEFGDIGADTQIYREIGYFKKYHAHLRPAMAISYDRIAMQGIADPELRITFDTNIRYRTNHLNLVYGNEGKEILNPGEHLMEIKVAGAMPMELAKILSELKIYKTSFSKYGKGYQMMLGERQQAKVVAFPTLPERTRALALAY